MSPPFGQLDFLYTPSGDVAADVRWFTEVLGGRLLFAIEAMGARVAMVALTEGPPHVLLTDHLEGDRPVFVYRVASIEETLAGLEERGWDGVEALTRWITSFRFGNPYAPQPQAAPCPSSKD